MKLIINKHISALEKFYQKKESEVADDLISGVFNSNRMFLKP